MQGKNFSGKDGSKAVKSPMPVARIDGCFEKMPDTIFVDVMRGKDVISKHDFQKFFVASSKTGRAMLFMYVKEGKRFKKIGVVSFKAIDRWIDTVHGSTIRFAPGESVVNRLKKLERVYDLIKMEKKNNKIYTTPEMSVCIDL